MKYILAPKYWARHNVSDGYWASEQNIYEGWHYQDRKGNVFTSQECKEELEAYKKNSRKYKKLNQRANKFVLFFQKIRCRVIYEVFFVKKIMRAIRRKVRAHL